MLCLVSEARRCRAVPPSHCLTAILGAFRHRALPYWQVKPDNRPWCLLAKQGFVVYPTPRYALLCLHRFPVETLIILWKMTRKIP